MDKGRKETMDEEMVDPAEAKFNQLLVHENRTWVGRSLAPMTTKAVRRAIQRSTRELKGAGQALRRSSHWRVTIWEAG